MNGLQYATALEGGLHPWWCARGHRCDATMGGHHSSAQETWQIGDVWLYIRRRRRYGRDRSTVEIRFDVPVPDEPEEVTRARLQRAIEAFSAHAATPTR